MSDVPAPALPPPAAASGAGAVLFLIGMPGSGKSTVGRHLGRLLAADCIDLDREIEASSGAPIATIFELEGEAGFRRRESQLLDQLSRAGRCVIATGGGAVLAAENRALMRARGLVIYLDAAFDELRRRLRGDRSRPLLQGGNPEQRLAELLAQRGPLYREWAHLTFVSGATNPKKLAARIAQDPALDAAFATGGDGNGRGVPTIAQ